MTFEDAGEGAVVTQTHLVFARHGEGWTDYRNAMASAYGCTLLIDRFRTHFA